MKLTVLLLLTSISIFSSANEDDPAKLCKSAASLFESGDVDAALEEARWCVTQLEKLKNTQVDSEFTDEILGFSGEEISRQSAMGMNIVEREYVKNDEYIKVTLTSGDSGAAVSAFAALAQFGMQSSSNKVRIQKRNANVEHDNGSTTITVSLKSGGMLTFESDSSGKDDVIAFAKKFPVKKLDIALMD